MVAKTILEQVGGKALFMMGAYCVLYTQNGVQFRIQGSKKASLIEIVLESSDTYTVRFYKGRAEPKMIKEVSDVYCDSLHSTIESVTGLYLSL